MLRVLSINFVFSIAQSFFSSSPSSDYTSHCVRFWLLYVFCSRSKITYLLYAKQPLLRTLNFTLNDVTTFGQCTAGGHFASVVLQCIELISCSTCVCCLWVCVCAKLGLCTIVRTKAIHTWPYGLDGRCDVLVSNKFFILYYDRWKATIYACRRAHYILCKA